MALKKRALFSALCCLGSFDATEMNQLLVVSRLMAATSTRTQPISGTRCAPPGGRWTKGSKRQGLEVLHGGSEKELVTCTRKPSQPHALKAVVNLQVGKAHLDAFALVARLEEGLCPHQPACHVAGILMNITGNLPRRTIRTTPHLEGTDIAIVLGCEIAKRFAFVHLAGGVQHLAVRADVKAPPAVPAKVAAR